MPLVLVAIGLLLPAASLAQGTSEGTHTPGAMTETGHKAGGEVNIVMPDLTNGQHVDKGITPIKADFLGGMSGHNLLLIGPPGGAERR